MVPSEQKRNGVADEALGHESVQVTHICAQQILLRVHVRSYVVLMWSRRDCHYALNQLGDMFDLNVV